MTNQKHKARGWPSMCIQCGHWIDLAAVWDAVRLDVDYVHACGARLYRRRFR
jgi:hypothetical protein